MVSSMNDRSWIAGHLTFSIQTHYNVKLGTEVVAIHIKSTLHMYQVDDVTFDPKDNVEKKPARLSAMMTLMPLLKT